MLRDYRAVRAVATQIADAAEIAIQGYREGKFTDEPHITDRLMATIEERVRNYVTPVAPLSADDLSETALMHEEQLRLPTHEVLIDGAHAKSPERKPLVWQAATLRTGAGEAAEEKRYGADVLGVLSVDTPGYKTNKGFLAQAKRAEPGKRFTTSEWERLTNQCDAMLAISRDAYVIVYSKELGVRFFSAQAVKAYSGRDLFELYHVGTRTFFERHIQSFIGDMRLDKPSVGVLKNLQSHRDETGANGNVLHLLASEVGDDFG